jgi:arginyl-tRNA synthetase
MASPVGVLTERFQRALVKAFGDEHADADPVIRPSQFADFQANAALALAKKLGEKPRDVAERIVEHLDLDGVAEAPEISGPGFVNLRLTSAWIAAELTGLDHRLGVPTQYRQVIPVDYSAPNVAKEMHVGHLRTTVVGDALVRTLEHLGHEVVRQNHVGDWGTPFGMLIEHLLAVGEDSPEAQLLVTDPNTFYGAAREEFDGDPAFADRARSRVVSLQAGDPDTLRLWDELVDLSKQYFNRIYATLGVTLTDADLAGESTYNAELA